MNLNEDYFLTHNKLIEDKLDYCIHNIESRLDKLYERGFIQEQNRSLVLASNQKPTSLSQYTYLQFRAPYIRDFRNFSGPANSDVRQIRDLTGTENIDVLIKNKNWSKEAKQQLCEAVLDHYAQIHIVELIKQKNILKRQLQDANQDQLRESIEQKLSLIEEQTEQVKARKEQRIFVPEDRNDSTIDWCAISARLTNTHHDAQDCRLMWTNCLHWTTNNGLWTKEEDECLLNAVQKFGKNDWDSVAKELNSNRLAWQCCARYNQEFNSVACSTPINEDDIDKIIEVINLCRIGNFVPWNQVMYFIQYHSLLQVKYQWHKLLSDRRSTQAWSHQEDVLLLKTVEKFGEKDWNRIANYIPGRSNKSCRERYTMRLRFSKRSVGNWKRKEDENLLALVEKFGTNWSVISMHFPERNGHQLRNRYELLKNDASRVGPIKHKKIYRNPEGQLVSIIGRRHKLSTEREVDEKLNEIFNTYQHVNKSTSKSLVCRSAQDELIYQNLIQVLRKGIANREIEHNLISFIIEKALKDRVSSKYEFFSPNLPTLRGYKAWMLQQDYLTQICDQSSDTDSSFESSSEYNHVLKIVMSIFLWPAILSRINIPSVDVGKYQVGSIIEKDLKNLYRIREIQKQIVSASL